MRRLLIPALLLSCSLIRPALAADPASPGDGQWCKDNPAKCEERKARRAEFCKKNPETCKQRKAELEKKKQWCKDNPAECKKMREERHARHERMREKCEANKEKCEERKEEFKEHRQERSAAFCKEHPTQCDGVPDEPAKADTDRKSGPPR